MVSSYKEKECANCGNLTRSKIYCSKVCGGQGRFFSRVFETIESGELPNHSITAKNQLKLFHGNICKICGISKWLGKEIMLILDHIDGNATNWKIENLRLICSNCDAQLPTYKNKNAGNGRFKRMERYNQGLSF